MRKAIASVLHRLANRIYNADHQELIEVRDEYGICRCRLEVVTDEFTHQVEATLVKLPAGWEFEEQEFYSDSVPRLDRSRQAIEGQP